MRIDPELDCIVHGTGRCLDCGGELGEGAVGEHCGGCIQRLGRTAQAPVDPRLEARRELALRELCRRRFLPFVQRLVPNYQAGWFHVDLAARLERFSRRVAAGQSPRLIVNCPPRHGKSEQASKGLPAWHLGKYPDHNIISTTHSDRLAMDNSRDVLNYIKDPRYQSVFPGLTLDKDNKGAMGWRTNEGGRYKPAGVGAGIAGYGGNILIIDDPHRDKDAYSQVVRDFIWRWYKSSARTRLMPGGGVLLIQTRWVLDDLTGRVIEEEGLIEDGGKWEQVCYPAQAVTDEYRLPTGRVIAWAHPKAQLLRRKGEYLHPERYDEAQLADAKKDPVTWAALYQQNPVAGEAATFTDQLLQQSECVLADVPERLVYYSTWDLAIGLTERNDWSVCMTGGVDADDTLWIVDLERGRWDGFEIVERLIDSYLQYDQAIIGVEKTHLSMAIGPFLEKRIGERRAHGLNVVDLPHGNRDKVARARPIQARMRQGKVKIPTDAPWYAALKKELLEFPGGRHDDMVDVLAYLGQLLLEMAQPFREQAPRQKSWRDRLAPGGRRNWKTA